MTRIVSAASAQAVQEATAVLGAAVGSPKAPTPASMQAQSIVPSRDNAEAYAAFLDERRRTSMSVPSQKMSLPEIPGYVCFWFNDEQGRVQRALVARWEFVDMDEVGFHDFSIAGDSTKAGNHDMGTRVSMIVGTKEGGMPLTAYAMKLRTEIWEIDQMLKQERNDDISRALKRGSIGMGDEGAGAQTAADHAAVRVKSVEISRRIEPVHAPFVPAENI